ncbi:MAG: 30S ribosomal protein S2 [Deltaproteobacteria bacterium]|nr:30S ribosomal protein S2 [Deltaproteobacteria bacterium]MBI4373622.1 30S ribosomal protein S2 [Deltaproteobacteria bacterium]
MTEVLIREMLEVGAHFGHQTRYWNPKMRPFIYGAKNGIHIIDLQKTQPLFEEACRFVTKVVGEGGELLFVGTKKQAQSIVEEEARRCNMFFVNKRWLGGTLTNFRTIKASLMRLKDFEKKRAEGGFEGLTKREKLEIEREIVDLQRSLGGIKEMTRLPQVIFLVDASKELIALQEALRLQIPVVALADTNCNPQDIDHLIPANDDALKSIRYFCHKVADACLEGLSRRATVMRERIQEAEGESVLKGVAGTKGHAYVSRPESYEGEGVGQYSSEQAFTEEEGAKKDVTHGN